MRSFARPHRYLNVWRRPSWDAVFLGVAGLSLLAFGLAPWPMQEKSLAVLHGLCSQRPSHSFWFDSARLPFDARMTGIYGGFLIGQLYLLGRRRLHAVGVPSVPIVATLAAFVMALAIDGVNSTLDDVGLVRLYQPTNALRFLTGAATGTTLAVFLWLLVGLVVWRPSRRSGEPVVRSWRELGELGLLLAGFGLLAGSGWTPLYRPLAFVLIVAAVLALTLLALAFIQLVRQTEGAARSPRDLAGPATAALLMAYLFMLLIGGGRFLLEATLGVQSLP